MSINDVTQKITGQSAILIAIGVVAAVGILGATVAPVSAVNILGFAAVIEASLCGVLVQMHIASRQEARTEVVVAKAEKAAEKVEVVAEKAEEVKTALKESTAATTKTLDRIETRGDQNHVLLNSQHGVLLKALAAALRVTADREGTKGTKDAAEAAERVSREHDETQAKAEAKETATLPDAGHLTEAKEFQEKAIEKIDDAIVESKEKPS